MNEIIKKIIIPTGCVFQPDADCSSNEQLEVYWSNGIIKFSTPHREILLTRDEFGQILSFLDIKIDGTI